jgi:multidrug efflux pump subunit AcrA (membrane-fusion protein)
MKAFASLILVGCCLAASPLLAQNAKPQAPAAPAAPAANPNEAFRSSEITFFGKLYSPLKISVFLPYPASINKINVHIGQHVKRGEILANYEIPMETRMDEKAKLAPTSVKDLEYRISVSEKELDRLGAKAKELEAMSQRNMASQQAMSLNAKEMESYRKEKASLTEQLILAKQLLADRVELAEDHFGKGAGVGKVPKDGVIKAPCDGYVMWMHPALRESVFLGAQTELFQVGTLNPMLIRAQVHEIETAKITENEKASVSFDSIPGKTFSATVSRIPWAPLPAALQQPSYYEIELTLANPDLQLREGLKAQITIQPGK